MLTEEEYLAHLQQPLGMGDVLGAIRHALAFDARGDSIPLKKKLRRCRRMMERIPDAGGNRPRHTGAIPLRESPITRALEKRWNDMSFVVQGNCARCPYHARKECKGARFA